MLRLPLSETPQAPICGGSYRSRAAIQDPARGFGVQSHDSAQKDSFGLFLRQRTDQTDSLRGRHQVADGTFDVIGGLPFGELLDRAGGLRPSAFRTQVVQSAVAADRGHPAAEAVRVALEAA